MTAVDKMGLKGSYAIVLAVWLIIVTADFFWLKADNLPHGYEVIDLLITQTRAYNILTNIFPSDQTDILSIQNLKNAIQQLDYFFNDFGALNRPNLVHFVASLGNLLFGRSVIVTTLFTNSLFVLILLLSVFHIGKLTEDTRTGVLAAFLIVLYPGIYGFTRKYGLDFPLTAMLSLCIWVLIKTENFSKRKYSVFFGIVAGLGILTKAQIVLFLFAPVTFYFCRIVKMKARDQLLNMLLSGAMATALSWVWFKGKFFELLKNFAWHASVTCNPASMVHRPWYDLSSIPFYLIETCRYISPLLIIAFLISLPFLFKEKTKHKVVLALWIIFPYIVFTLIADKWGRFYFPSFPAIAILTAMGLSRMDGRLGKTITVLFLGVGFAQFFVFSTDINFVPRHMSCKLALLDPHDDLAHPPIQTNHEAVAKNLTNIFSEFGFSYNDPVRVGVIERRTEGTREFNGDYTSFIEFFLLQQNPSLEVFRSSCARGLHEAQAFLDNSDTIQFLLIPIDTREKSYSVQYLDRCQKWGDEQRCLVDEKRFSHINEKFRKFKLLERFRLKYDSFDLVILVNPNLDRVNKENYEDKLTCAHPFPLSS